MPDVQESDTKVARLLFPLTAIPNDVGAAVSVERVRLGWTKAKLARKTRLSRATIHRLETGVRPLADTLFRVAHAFDMPIRQLVPDWQEWAPIRGTLPGDRARKRRKELGMTLAEVASIVGVSEATLSRFERGVCSSPDFLRREGDDYVPCNGKLEAVLAADGLTSRPASLRLVRIERRSRAITRSTSGAPTS